MTDNVQISTDMAPRLFVALQIFPCEVQTTTSGLLLTHSLFLSSGDNIVMTVGDSSVLTCIIKGKISMLTWTINPKVGGPCTLVYRIDKNVTHRTNCSDNINWTFRAGLAPALLIQQVGIAQEGNYLCETASTEGNFRRTYNLTVLGKECANLEISFCKIKEGRVRLDIRKLFGIVRVLRHWYRLSREAVDVPMLRARLGET